MNEDEKVKKTLDKVSKLVNVANSTSNVDEASAFMARAMEMLAEAGLSASDIPTEKREDGFICEVFQPKYAHEEWRVRVAVAASKVYMCKILILNNYPTILSNGKYGYRTAFHVLGRPVNVKVFITMVDYILETVMRLRRKEKLVGGKAQHQFQIGCGLKVTKRLYEMYAAMMEGKMDITNSSNLPALYKNEDALIDTWMREKFDDLKKVKSRKSGADTYNPALTSGWLKGDQVSLQAQLKGTEADKFLLGTTSQST